MNDKLKGYPIVSMVINDHGQGGGKGVCRCKVWGLLVSEDEETYHIYQWCYDGKKDDDVNNHISSVVKDAVEEIWEFGLDTIY